MTTESNRYMSDLNKINWGEKVFRLFSLVFQMANEVYNGAISKTIPLGACAIWGTVVNVFIAQRWDYKLFCLCRLEFLYPTKPFFFWSYSLLAIPSGFWFWGILKTIEKRKLTQRLTVTFQNASLKNALGQLPGFVFDKPIDEYTRKLRLSRAHLPLASFLKAKDALESSLQIYVDEMRENRECGTIDITYAHDRMPDFAKIEGIHSVPADSFVIGKTRSKQIIANLSTTPHLLIAGQTGGGKSSFLRQFITTLYLNNKNYHFVLIDLKGGLEFQLFENLPRTIVIPDVSAAVTKLMSLQKELENRMALLKANECKDLEAYRLKLEREPENTPKTPVATLGRHLIIIDEATEMFLAGHHAEAEHIQTARRILSQIARQGRSVGVHLVVATQRPDTKALDPQVKANLTGVLCFQMANDASSITVLGNGRATDLPKIPGRALWKNGGEMVEVQTPYLGTEEVDAFLEKKRIPKSPEVKTNEVLTVETIPEGWGT